VLWIKFSFYPGGEVKMSKCTDGEMKQIEMAIRNRLGSGGGITLLIGLLLSLNALLEEAKAPVVSAEEAAKKKADEEATSLAAAEEQAVLAQQIADKEASDKDAAEKQAADLAELAKQQAATEAAAAEQKAIAGSRSTCCQDPIGTCRGYEDGRICRDDERPGRHRPYQRLKRRVVRKLQHLLPIPHWHQWMNHIRFWSLRQHLLPKHHKYCSTHRQQANQYCPVGRRKSP
jgi:hypothetical protein